MVILKVEQITPEKIKGAKDSDVVEILNTALIAIQDLETRVKKLEGKI